MEKGTTGMKLFRILTPAFCGAVCLEGGKVSPRATSPCLRRLYGLSEYALRVRASANGWTLAPLAGVWER